MAKDFSLIVISEMKGKTMISILSNVRTEKLVTYINFKVGGIQILWAAAAPLKTDYFQNLTSNGGHHFVRHEDIDFGRNLCD